MPRSTASSAPPPDADELGAGHPPSFVNWAAGEVTRLRASITTDTTREERFQIQSRVGALLGVAHSYGLWLYRRDW